MDSKDFDKGASEESAKTIVQLAVSIFKEIKKRALDEIKIKVASKNYSDRYISRNGYIQVLGMPEPKPIEDIYTNVITVDPSYLTKESEIELLEQSFKDSSRKFIHSKSIKSGIEVANEKQKLNILGPPGSGKSTFLKRLGILSLNKSQLDLSEEHYEHHCIPVLIELKRFRNEPIDLKTIIQKEFEIAGFPESDWFIDGALKQGKLLILLDGLDEVPLNKLNETIDHIKDFTDKYKSNRFVTSCRTAFYKTYLKGFSDIEIAPFNEQQIKKFIYNWFGTQKDIQADTAPRFIDLLFQKNNESTLELAQTPLLLTFLCLTFDDSQRFPANRSNLYRRALMILLEKWAAEKRIHNDDIYQNFTSELEIEMLAEIAASFYKENKIFFYNDELKQSIRTFFENSSDLKPIDYSKILEAIEVQQGLLVQRAPEIYSFSHLTIQEYLTADFYNTPKRVKDLIKDFLLNKKWREVFLLLAGIGRSDDLLLLMVEYLNNYAETDTVFKKAKTWVGKTLKSSLDYEKDACRKVFLIGLLLHFKRYESSHNSGLETYSNRLLASLNPSFSRSHFLKATINKKNGIEILELVSSWGVDLIDYSLYKEEINAISSDLPLSGMLHGSRFKYRKQILVPLYDALGVPDEIGFLPRNEYKTLINYLEAYTLIVDCKEASLRVSKDTWQAICTNLF